MVLTYQVSEKLYPLYDVAINIGRCPNRDPSMKCLSWGTSSSLLGVRKERNLSWGRRNPSLKIVQTFLLTESFSAYHGSFRAFSCNHFVCFSPASP